VALYGEKESFASYILQKNGIKKLDVLKYISHGVSLVPKNMETSLKSLETDTYLEAYQYADDWEYDYEYEILMKMKTLMKKAPQKATFWSTLQLTLPKKQKG